MNSSIQSSNTYLYKVGDVKLLEDNIDEIKKNADLLRLAKVEPTKDKLWDIIYTVRDFVIEKKRKIYGGFALNKLIENVAPEDKFYDDENIDDWDFDFYSPEPINDAIEIANRLFAKGYKHVRAQEAQHDETYKVFAETKDCADISYVPRNIYNHMPFNIINGLCLTGPHFMMIDYFRILTDPLTSYFRLEKSFYRLTLMAKHYPLPHNTSTIDVEQPERDLDVAFNTVHNFLIDRESCIVIGMYVYNYLIKESTINERHKNIKRSKNKNKNKSNTMTKIDYSDINCYEVISTEYKRDARELIILLIEKFKYNSKVTEDRITYEENYPFFQFLGYSVNIYFDNEIICKMYHYNNRCTPYFDVPPLYFHKSSYIEYPGKIRIGTFATIMMYNLINIMRARSNNDNYTKNLYYTMISHIIEMKNYFFEKTKKNIMDKTLFQEFILVCIGNMMTPQMEKQERIYRKIQAGKKYTFSYNPENEKDRDREVPINYAFKNSSGNLIHNKKNLKINLDKLHDNADINSEEDVEDIDNNKNIDQDNSQSIDQNSQSNDQYDY